MIFLTSDSHFSHANILKYCDRPYDTVEEMDKDMIARWNRIVGEDDYVYHLGDLTLGDDAGRYLRQLNGCISILATWWHHDKRWLAKVRKSIFEFGNIDIRSASNYLVRLLPPMYLLQVPDIPPITLSHYPMHSWEQSHRGAYHCFGHTHNRYHPDNLSMDVGVDANNFYPVSIVQVQIQMKEKTDS